MEMITMDKNKKSGCGCILGIIIIIILTIIVTILILYMVNPVKLESNLININNKLQKYVLELNHVKPADDNLVFPEEEKLTEAQKYYYYQQLSDTAKKIYITIENNIEKCLGKVLYKEEI